MDSDSDLSNVNDDSQKIILNKSASFSGSPIAEKYEIKQIFKGKDGETLFRHYSYEIPDRRKPYVHEIQQFFKYIKSYKKKEKVIKHSDDYNFTPYEGGTHKKSQQIKFGTTFDYFFNFAKHVPEEQGFEKFLTNNKVECTPMDVDTSFNSDKSFDNTMKSENEKYMIDVHYQDRENNETEHKSKVPKLILKPNKSVDIIKLKLKKQKTPRTKKLFLIRMLKIFFTFFIPISLGLICMFCNSESDLIHFNSKDIIDDLQKYLYGQERIIEKLEYNLNLFKNQKVFLFSGGNGVGKTFTAHIIEKNYPHKDSIQKYIFNPDQVADLERKIIINMEPDIQNLIIIDGLVRNDIYSILPIINGLSVNNNKFIIIVIFNLQETSEEMLPSKNLKVQGREISKIFNDNNISHSSYMFENLSCEDTKECIRFNMKSRGFIVNEDVVDEVLDNINYKYSGCKGVYAKVSLVENKLESS